MNSFTFISFEKESILFFINISIFLNNIKNNLSYLNKKLRGVNIKGKIYYS